jgi:hypothetical protein
VSVDAPPATYSFAAPATRGVLLGLGPARVVGLVVGTAGFVAVLLAHGPLVAAIAPVALALVWGWLAVGDRRVHEWAAPVAHHAALTIAGRRRWSAGRLRVGADVVERVELPAELGRIRWLAVTQADWEAGIVIDRAGGARRATLILDSDPDLGWGLAADDERARLIDGWAQTLAATAVEHGSVHRLQWVERAQPAAPDLAHTALDDVGDDRRVDYHRLVAACRSAAVSHRTHLALQTVVTGDGHEAAAERLLSDARLLSARLAALGVRARPLNLEAVARLVRAYTAPAPLTVADPAVAGPAGRKVAWDHLVTEDAWHRAYEVVAWPRRPVGPGWLGPLLAAPVAPATRTLAVHLAPVATRLALRRAAAARVAVALDDEQRARYGLLSGHRQAREAADADIREAELVAGHAEYQLAAVILLSARSKDELNAAAGGLMTGAAAAGVELRVAYGRQAWGWAAALPLCRARLAGGR